MNPEELLLHHAREYLSLSEEYGPDASCVNEQFRKLRDLLIVEIYFMNSVRSILSDDEMSGFVLYVEGGLRTMIDSFDPKREYIMPFLRHNMENRALSYLESERRRKCFNSPFASRFLAIEPEYPGPEDLLPGFKDVISSEMQEKAIDRLRYICYENPSKQKHLFIFLCTILPHATPEMIDNFCGVLNIDKEQTFTIADYLYDISKGEGKRSPREYLKDRRNFYLMRRIELESHLRYSLYPERIKSKLKYQDEQLANINKEISHKKMNIQYQLLSEVLGIESSYIATAVYRSKKVLELVSTGENEQNNNNMGHRRNVLQVSDNVLRRAMPNRFEPFEQFNITLIQRPNTHIRFSAQDMGIA